MTRHAVPGLPSRYPLGTLLPAMYAEDDFAQRFTAGLDQVLAPILSTLDNLAHYFDPRVTPADFAGWLAEWVAVELDPAWPLELRRAVLRRAVELHRQRGTAHGLVDLLRLCAGVQARVLDGPGSAWSTRPGTALPGTAVTGVVVQVWPGRSEVDRHKVTALVESARPVHLTCTVEVLPGPPQQRRG
ncbi:phage tail protein [Saccharopolyspora dendranthemae]|uniref:Phage tail P2-like protein n=1 Tax=Saccharopolyspora dendranthemae TaxID=1181886 RepID=A0A561U820_9PSEU|nr:phage tail protein [Saccharopolyspora dendranthemae]TWF95509.1 phage tail P2-like protein [Saccharopolyspora dendranthemae]